uniref:Uncharacterized protein n=1 Tax=Romanomermis culicivorax TaxID=13658 RepID=A0A915J832_ROMCU
PKIPQKRCPTEHVVANFGIFCSTIVSHAKGSFILASSNETEQIVNGLKCSACTFVPFHFRPERIFCRKQSTLGNHPSD